MAAMVPTRSRIHRWPTCVGRAAGDEPSESVSMNERLRVAITLEQCWHRVPGGTATSIIELDPGAAARADSTWSA